MLIQHRARSIYLISQNDHALVSGEMARRWIGGVSIDAVLAIALHDSAWIAVDGALPFDSSRGLPHDFQSLSDAAKAEVYRAGIDRLEVVQPYASLLVSRHYRAFVGGQPGFHKGERDRDARLVERLGDRVVEAVIARDLALLRLLDLLSLRLCLTVPGVVEGSWPGWVTGAAKWEGVEIRTAWKDACTMVFDPFPFEAPFEVSLPFESVRTRGCASETEWRRLRDDAVRGVWNLRLVPA